MATRRSQQDGKSSAHVTEGEGTQQRTLVSPSAASLTPLLSSSSSSLSSSSSSSSFTWDDSVTESDTSCSPPPSQVSASPATTQGSGSSSSPPVRLAAPQAGRGTATLTPTPSLAAPPSRQVQTVTLVTPCGSAGSVACGGATGGEKTGSVRDTNSMNFRATPSNCSASLNTASAPLTRPKAPSQISSSVASPPHPPPVSSSHGGSRLPAPSVPCSLACTNNYLRLSKELHQAKDQIFALSVQMAEQSSHISKLMEENRRYIRENGKLKKKSASRSGATLLSPRNFDHFGSHGSDGSMRNVGGEYQQTDGMLTELQDRVMALQLHNDELNVCLEREKRRRREAEARVERDEGYIKRLEDNVQALKGTRVVMDSSAYRQLAEAYIASRRPPARRPHNHVHPGSDLVCDSSSNTSLDLPETSFQTSSCPSSPKSDLSVSSSTSSSMYPADPQLFPAAARRSGSVRGPKERNSGERAGRQLGGAPMNPWDYQQLLESLEDLDGGSRGALS